VLWLVTEVAQAFWLPTWSRLTCWLASAGQSLYRAGCTTHDTFATRGGCASLAAGLYADQLARNRSGYVVRAYEGMERLDPAVDQMDDTSAFYAASRLDDLLDPLFSGYGARGQDRWPVPFFVGNLLLFGGLLGLAAYHTQPAWIRTWRYWMVGLPFASIPIAVISLSPVTLWDGTGLADTGHEYLLYPIC